MTYFFTFPVKQMLTWRESKNVSKDVDIYVEEKSL